LFWDNVGGDTLDAVFPNMATFGRIVHCGAISQYNKGKEAPKGNRNEPWMFDKRLRCEGFIVFDWRDSIDEAINQLAKWYKEGKIKKGVTLKHGLENVPDAFIGLFKGENKGKMLVKL